MGGKAGTIEEENWINILSAKKGVAAGDGRERPPFLYLDKLLFVDDTTDASLLF